MKPATLVATILFSLVAILHLVRLFYHVEVTVNGAVVPMWSSAFVFLFIAGLVIMMWRENRRK
jgi:hypothetical protein